jgi:AAA domain (dynein-related subfamily)
MGLTDLTSREAIHSAIEEFEALGQKAFLAKYEFKPSLDYVLVQDGNRYDSKAIVAAAHGFQHSDLGPLRSGDFNGGEPTVAKLESLGFKVEQLTPFVNEIAFTADDCAVFARYDQRVPWAQVTEADQEAMRDSRRRLRTMARAMATEPLGGVTMRPFVSTLNPNGRSPSDMWCCIFPEVVPNKSYALQVALIIKADGAELCVCLGSGQAQERDPDRIQANNAAQERLKRRLAAIPSDVRQMLARSLDGLAYYRKQWRAQSNSRSFDSIDEWLAHAAGPSGDGAAISRNFTPPELENLGTAIGDELKDLAQRAKPLFTYAYSRHEPETDDPLEAFVRQWKAEEDDADANERAEESRTTLATLLERDALAHASREQLRDIAGDNSYGGAGKGGALARSFVSAASDEELTRFRDAIEELLYGDDPLPHRIDAFRDAGFYNVRGVVTIKLLALRFPGRILAIWGDGPNSKEALMQSPALGLTPPTEGSFGERSVAANDALIERLRPYFDHDTWRMKEFLYWLTWQEQPAGGGEGSREDTLEALAASLFIDKEFLERAVSLLESKRQLIFYGPPGTGKTFIARKLARFLSEQDPDRLRIVQFHPSYSYEDFVQGYRPVTDDEGNLSYELQHGPLLKIAIAARERRDEQFVLLVDEINRGNLPRILGELLFLLEYRDEQITLMYSSRDERFSLPPNLWIVGTMNTADRSIGMIDAALRRRFAFLPLFPNRYPLIDTLGDWLQAHVPSMSHVADLVDTLNARLRERFGDDLQVGPSYFMTEELTEERLKLIWDTNILPFLEDQLYDSDASVEEFDIASLEGATSSSARGGEEPEDEDSASPGVSDTD